MAHKIRVERNRLRFAAAHFATFAGDCEPLHGHNYDVIVEVEGDLTEDAWVMDFSLLKRVVQEICSELDHKFLLQRQSHILTISEEADAWQVSFRERVYRFPKTDVVALPIDNSTAERLAEWFWQRIWQALQEMGLRNLTRVRVGVEEMPGQAGWYSGPAG